MSSSGCMSGLNFRHAAFEFRHTDDDVWPRPLSTSEFPRLSSFAFVVFFLFATRSANSTHWRRITFPPYSFYHTSAPPQTFVPPTRSGSQELPTPPLSSRPSGPTFSLSKNAPKLPPPQSLKQANTHHWAATCRGATYQSGEQGWWGRGEEKQEKLVLKRDEKGAKTLHH